MASFDRYFSGTVTGDKRGKFILEITKESKQKQEGILSFDDLENGQQKYFLWWEIQDVILKFAGIKEENYQKDHRPILRGEAFLNINNTLQGKWYTNDGLNGCFSAYNHPSKLDIPVSRISGCTDRGLLQLEGQPMTQNNSSPYSEPIDKKVDKEEEDKSDHNLYHFKHLRYTIWDR